MAAASSDGLAVSAPPGYEALVADAAWYRDAARRVLRVEGDRAADMLDGLLTADIRDPGAGAAFPTLILTPKGRVLADAVVVRVGDAFLLDIPEAARSGLEPHFGRYLPPRFARLEPAGLEVVRLRGPNAADAARRIVPDAAGLPAPERRENEGARWAARATDHGILVRRGGRGGEGFDLYVARGGADPADGLDPPIAVASDEAWEAWRIERGLPRFGRDVTEENLPQETGLVAETTSFGKGCYTGQEVLARIHYRGKVNRHLRGLRVHDEGGGEGAELSVGDELRRGGRVVGSVTSVARSPRAGHIGLGYVRREVEPGDDVEAGSGAREAVVRVEELPIVD